MHLQREKFRAFEPDISGSLGISFAAHQDVSQGSLAGALGSEKSVNFLWRDCEIKLIQNGEMAHPEGETANFQEW